MPKVTNNRVNIDSASDFGSGGSGLKQAFKIIEDRIDELVMLLDTNSGGEALEVGSLLTTGNADIGGALEVTGATTLVGATAVTADLTVNGTSGSSFAAGLELGGGLAIGDGNLNVSTSGCMSWATGVSSATSLFDFKDKAPTNLFEVDASGDGGMTIEAWTVGTAGAGFINTKIGSTTYRIPLMAVPA